MITSSYFIFFTKIEFQRNISSSNEIKNLNDKIFWDLGFYKPEKISTDFSLNKIKNNIATYDFNASQDKKCGQLEYFRLNQSTGFGGNLITIYRLGSRFRIEMEDFSDNEIQNNSKKGYKILSQKLILNKRNYNIKDSIYGKIEIKFRDNSNSLVNYGSGCFRTVME